MLQVYYAHRPFARAATGDFLERHRPYNLLTENPPQAAPLPVAAVRRVSGKALALALSFLFEVACRETDGRDNRLVISSDARLHPKSQERTQIFF